MITRRLAFYDLRDWWLSDDRVRTLLRIPEDEDYGPFYPAAKQPETALPYIIYDVDRRIETDRWWMHMEIVTLNTFFEDIEDSNEFMNILIDYSSQGDASASALHRWLNESERDIDFLVHSIQYMAGGSLEAAEEQGGATGRIMTFMISYSPVEGRLITN